MSEEPLPTCEHETNTLAPALHRIANTVHDTAAQLHHLALRHQNQNRELITLSKTIAKMEANVDDLTARVEHLEHAAV